jgi:tetratricopeptide (TPR) repeat protein
MTTMAGAAAIAWILAASAPAERPGRALFERAEANFNRGNFEAARLDYQAAYDVEPLPAFLFNIGQCYRNLGDYTRAQFFFQRFTILDPGSPKRPAAERLIVEMGRLEEERRAQARTEPPPPSLTPAALAARPTPANEDGKGAMLRQTGAPANPPRPFYRRAWFWAGIGGAILLGSAVALALSDREPDGTLPPIDAR